MGVCLDFKFLKEIDFYGKSPEFYYKGSSKKKTYIGRIMTIIYILIYIIFLIYKLNRMVNRVDISFFDVYSNNNELPSFQITNETFYLLFAIFNTSTDEPIIDETIYYPIATFNNEEEKDIKDEIIVERCTMGNIATKYKKLYEEYNLDNYYCLKDVNRTLIPYYNSFYVKIFPCKNSSENNNHCKSKEIIDETIKGNYFSFEIPDIILTPEDFKNPVSYVSNYFYAYLYKKYGQYIYIQMESAFIETDHNIIGFDFFTNIKNDNFMKFEDIWILPKPGYDLDDKENQQSICEFEVSLGNKILIEKRSYSKLIDILGEIGGFMEIIYSVFNLICSILVDILYDISIVNNFFMFDLKNKHIIINNKIQKRINHIKQENNKSKGLNELLPNYSPVLLKRNNNYNNSSNIKYSKKKRNNLYLSIIEKNYNNSNDDVKIYSKASNIPIQPRIKELEIEQKNELSNNLINKLEKTQYLFHLCFLCTNKRKNINNILFEEGMNIVSEKLDIFNIFKIVNRNDIYDNIDKIEMSKECVKNLNNLNKN